MLTLRLLPPLARLAERRATGGRGLTTALAAWQLARRPMRGAGPVLLLVLAVALGVPAIGLVVLGTFPGRPGGPPTATTP
ncbi:hypothetical protein J5Y05_22335 [Streptomyces sp. RG38]|uniref:Uncharacterized protein n=1 Tax=Streptomyces tagetis TaxID=2820809 RepID=A0A940XKM0_9ACTN|nr:hypothetical protein [Streptomyces sp. RG38]